MPQTLHKNGPCLFTNIYRWGGLLLRTEESQPKLKRRCDETGRRLRADCLNRFAVDSYFAHKPPKRDEEAGNTGVGCSSFAWSENPRKNRVHVSQLMLDVKGPSQSFGRNTLNARVTHDQFPEIQPFFPSPHGV